MAGLISICSVARALKARVILPRSPTPIAVHGVYRDAGYRLDGIPGAEFLGRCWNSREKPVFRLFLSHALPLSSHVTRYVVVLSYAPLVNWSFKRGLDERKRDRQLKFSVKKRETEKEKIARDKIRNTQVYTHRDTRIYQKRSLAETQQPFGTQ